MQINVIDISKRWPLIRSIKLCIPLYIPTSAARPLAKHTCILQRRSCVSECSSYPYFGHGTDQASHKHEIHQSDLSSPIIFTSSSSSSSVVSEFLCYPHRNYPIYLNSNYYVPIAVDGNPPTPNSRWLWNSWKSLARYVCQPALPRYYFADAPVVIHLVLLHSLGGLP